MNTRKYILAMLALPGLLCVAKVSGQTNIGQWDFKNTNLSQTIGANLGPLAYADGPNGNTSNLTIFATTTNLDVSSVAGVVTNIMRFPGETTLNGGTGYIMPIPPANGGGTLVNEYTLIVDVLYTNTGTFRPILQMDNGELDDILAFFDINQFDQVEVTNTLGTALPTAATGHIDANTWYRIGFVLDADGGQFDVYTNGQEAASVYLPTGQASLDGPYALYPGLPLFSSTITNVQGFVNSVQLRDTNLDAGQMAALGGPSPGGIPITIPPVKTFVQQRFPNFGDHNVLPVPNFDILLNQGDTVVDTNSIQVFLDGALIPSSEVPTPPTFSITAGETNLMAPGSLHTLTVAWIDSVAGASSNSWNFTVLDYQVINLPTPFYYETFDEVNVTSNGSLPTGWYATNETTVQDVTNDLCDVDSIPYENWLVDTTNIICGGGTSPCGGGLEADMTNEPPIELNGSLIHSLASTNVMWFESDNRCSGGCFGQAGFVFTPDISCSGQSNVYVCFNSMWMQNRNSFGLLEYSIDQGTNWLPALYLIASSDGDNYSTVAGAGGSRVIYTNGVIDVTATFETPYEDQAGYPTATDEEDAHWMAAPVSTADIPFIQGFPDDGVNNTTTGGGVVHSQWMGKEIEEIRLVSADFQPHVRFRFGYTGRCSWYWGIDNFGLYSINTPAIATQPLSQSVDANAPVTLTIEATGAAPLTYQWQFDGKNIAGATNSSYTIASASPTNAGTYTVTVVNPFGPITSDPTILTVYTTPHITAGPVGEIADPGASVTFTAAATGALPLTYIWLFDDAQVQSSTDTPYTVNNIQTGNAGSFNVVVSNTYGAITSSVALLKVFSGPITNGLVVHLPFDGNFNDTSGQDNNAAYATNGPDADPNPTFVPGKIGEAFEYTTTTNASIQEYATLGYPTDLQLDSTNDFSVSMWVNYTNQQDDLPFICNKDWNSSSDVGWGVFSQSGGNYRINVTGPNGGEDKYSETDTPSTLKDGNWHNVLVSFQRAPYGSSAFVYGYLDGVLVSKHPMGTVGDIDTLDLDFTNEQAANSYEVGVETGPLPDNQTSFAVNIGQDGTGVYHDQGSAHDIDAKIDDVGIWLRALTANEAAGIYQAGMAGEDLTTAVSAALTATISGSGSGANLVLNWTGGPTVEVETTPSLSPANWTPVAGTLGASTVSLPFQSAVTAFFRLVTVQ
ncbi:MAG TPA: LamG-like jellyroll fold domain-containing protein [Candidatus Baltobacteraceae bacterium]|jgi:hypothetical protein|nr:LamG-like jellyroll fold domain-containing protein [Candidatus Baltobacteraceae bacterium]